MIIHEPSVEAMNDQIMSEFFTSAQYVVIAIYFDGEGLPDLAQFYRAQNIVSSLTRTYVLLYNACMEVYNQCAQSAFLITDHAPIPISRKQPYRCRFREN